eukprot:1149389-Pelagomonas_calceolata.AAC.11
MSLRIAQYLHPVHAPPSTEGGSLLARKNRNPFTFFTAPCKSQSNHTILDVAQDVAIEIVDAVVDALMGKLSANAVNAPMVPPEVLKELQPFIALAEGLGKAAVSLTGEGSTIGLAHNLLCDLHTVPRTASCRERAALAPLPHTA